MTEDWLPVERPSPPAKRLAPARPPHKDQLRDLRQAALDPTSVSLGGRRTDSVHEFYRYPARFSPQFAKAAIEAFTEPGDLVVDPFCGGGTSVVEAQSLGRCSVGADINSLATFVTRAKTTLYSDKALREVGAFGHAALDLALPTGQRTRNDWSDQGYWRNISDQHTWRIRNLLANGIAETENLEEAEAEHLARCALLRTGQWALDMRRNIPGVSEFRQQLARDTNSMVAVAKKRRDTILSDETSSYNSPLIIDEGLPKSASYLRSSSAGPAALVLTSPPYPGVYVNYHRWKVRGRKETPAPYWVANRLDGHGISRYTMSARNRDGLRLYFTKLRTALQAVVSMMSSKTWLVQVVGFSDNEEQFSRYLELMDDLGLEELCFASLATGSDGRLWRQVPGRRWWVAAAGLSGTAPSTAREVVLVHRRTA